MTLSNVIWIVPANALPPNGLTSALFLIPERSSTTWISDSATARTAFARLSSFVSANTSSGVLRSASFSTLETRGKFAGASSSRRAHRRHSTCASESRSRLGFGSSPSTIRSTTLSRRMSAASRASWRTGPAAFRPLTLKRSPYASNTVSFRILSRTMRTNASPDSLHSERA